MYIVGEFIGAMIGAILVAIHYWDHFKATEDQGLKLAVFSTGPNIRNYGAQLRLRSHRHLRAGVRRPRASAPTAAPTRPRVRLGALPVALLVWSIGMSLGGTTGYAINPARDLGPRIIHAILPVPGKGGSDWGYSWVPVVGPIVGGILAALVYNGRLGQHAWAM